jgi:Protein of unknown function (DUF2946)
MTGAKRIRLPRNLRLFLCPRSLLVLFVLIALGFNSYITQTHIHVHPDALRGASAGDEHTKGHGDDSKNCPFCQAMVSSGVFIASAPPLLALPIAWMGVSTPQISLVSLARTVFSAWRSRAPPLR